MIQDINLAEQVNLLESSKDINPNDLYSFRILDYKYSPYLTKTFSPKL